MPAHALSTYQSDVVNDSAIGYWTLDNHASDSLTDQTGLGTNINYSTGHVNQADSIPPLVQGDTKSSWFGAGQPTPNSLASSDSAYAAPDTSGVYDANTNISLEAWARPGERPSAYNYATIAAKNGSYALLENGDYFSFVTKSGNTDRFCDDSTSITSYYSNDSAAKFHLVGTYDGSYMKLYVNGSLVCSASATGNLDMNSGALVIGSWDTSNLFYQGLISNVAVYSSVLSSTQVSSHYSDGHL